MELWTKEKVAQMIDHTLLKPEATEGQIVDLCRDACAYKVAAVCIHPIWVSTAASLLTGSGIKVATVIGFPTGATRVKALEARDALQAGAQELDMVMQVGWAKMGRWADVEADIRAVVEEAKQVPQSVVKVILETALLTDEEIVEACRCAVAAGAHFVKTSTGFGPSGATAHHVALMRQTVGADAQVKASGGIRTAADALAMLQAGATRIGTSATGTILAGF
ncbi:deoxyribose-phosphate aldolase [Heliophilum fasciatum]|uniref:Deoxyribose-phosphate aldolase n=1 Tax=Heliophilum fasciatum TaxID=35700 RepID=A0A4V2SWZ8_9FIRM|nr:deoxyribose-phosphate aldolase [Heliophilum fasciatum]MCW2278146.1 deoxyribose-phosphate aldolase [Heliophilum fasciatum]TCP64216.1 deoxyribose-phosphate aldolase [Heliophilum fasciatum]